MGIKGLSVTIPHKEEIVKRLTEADGAVRSIGAANTVVFQGDARLGYNTDYRAAMSSLEEAVAVGEQESRKRSCSRARRPWSSARRGGMAIGYGLLRRGANWSSPTATPGRPTCWPSGSIAAASTGRCGTR